jgi:cyclopropane fatty-acyl-phospholipid synthase-like methyltransferase
LDVGSGAGSHSLYLQNEKKLSNRNRYFASNKTCQLRGIKNTLVLDVLTLETKKFDTILLLTERESLEHLKTPLFFTKVKVLLKPTGQILIDSSDIIYMFDEDEDGASLYQLISIMEN